MFDSMIDAGISVEPRHPIRVVATRTGLSVAVIRAWEKRYGAVDPGRSGGGQRLYSDADIERLSLLRRATLGGRPIGRVAELPDDELRELLAEDQAALARRPDGGAAKGADTVPESVSRQVEVLMARAVDAVEQLDRERLENVLRHAVIALGGATFADAVATPLLRQIGDRWQAGSLSPAHEHIASSAMRVTLEWLAQASNGHPKLKRIVIATPSGERHELGAMLAAATAAAEGWSVTFLGADLPARDIAHAAQRIGAHAVALSVIHGTAEAGWKQEVAELRRLLPANVPIVVGGNASSPEGLPSDQAIMRIGDLNSFRFFLQRLTP